MQNGGESLENKIKNFIEAKEILKEYFDIFIKNALQDRRILTVTSQLLRYFPWKSETSACNKISPVRKHP